MSNKNLIAGFAIIALGIFAGIAYSFAGFGEDSGMGKGFGSGLAGENFRHFANSTGHAEFEAALESGDYNAAKVLAQQYGFGGRMFAFLNDTSFADFVSMHKAMENGDFLKADEIRQSLRSASGVGNGNSTTCKSAGSCAMGSGNCGQCKNAGSCPMGFGNGGQNTGSCGMSVNGSTCPRASGSGMAGNGSICPKAGGSGMNNTMGCQGCAKAGIKMGADAGMGGCRRAQS